MTNKTNRNNAEPLSESEKQRLFNEAFATRSFIKQMSPYQVETVYRMVKSRMDRKNHRFIDIIQANPDYPYPAGWPEDRLVEYWQNHDQEYERLQQFKAALVMNLHQSSNIPEPGGPQDATSSIDPSETVMPNDRKLWERAVKTAGKRSAGFERPDTMYLFLKTAMDQPDQSAENQRELAISKATDSQVIRELEKIPVSTLYTWRKKLD